MTLARELVHELEQKWSRFLPDSEISHVNHVAGNVSIVSAETFALISRAVDAQELTDGRFNPLMLHQLTELGYDTPWEERDSLVSQGTDGVRSSPATDEPILLFPEINAVQLPTGVGFDPGGIGKGLAADLVTDFLVANGATSTSVELGGDLRVSGEPWYATTWEIGVANPFDRTTDIASFSPECGAVATSSILRRCWTTGNEQRHHLLDPTTGRSAVTDLVSVTACSSMTWWAEIAAKVALMAGSADAVDLLRRFGTPGVVVAADGNVYATETADLASPASPRKEQVNA